MHLAFLSYEGGTAALAPTLAATARAAEDAGVARLTVMDHVWQIGGFGPPEEPMLEAYTALGFLAAHTSRVLLHTLVTGVVYRAPGLLAKQISTLDALSGGRAGLGIGAAWNEEESRGLGLDFPPIAERFERLEEALQICLQMWSDDDGPYEGRHYQLARTLNSPQNLSRPRPYILIGGGGEKKTLRLVAQYADACNLAIGDDAPHKFDVLKRHCDDVGRDFATVEKTASTRLTPETSRDELLANLDRARELGFSVVYVTPTYTDPLAAVDLIASVVDEVAAY